MSLLTWLFIPIHKISNSDFFFWNINITGFKSRRCKTRIKLNPLLLKRPIPKPWTIKSTWTCSSPLIWLSNLPLCRLDCRLNVWNLLTRSIFNLMMRIYWLHLMFLRRHSSNRSGRIWRILIFFIFLILRSILLSRSSRILASFRFFIYFTQNLSSELIKLFLSINLF